MDLVRFDILLECNVMNLENDNSMSGEFGLSWISVEMIVDKAGSRRSDVREVRTMKAQAVVRLCIGLYLALGRVRV